MDYAVLLMRLTLSNCTFREIVVLLSNADGVNSPITVQLVAVIFQLLKLTFFYLYVGTQGQVYEAVGRVSNPRNMACFNFLILNAKYLCKHYVPVLYMLVLVNVFARTEKWYLAIHRLR
jgi:hypothetical protein